MPKTPWQAALAAVATWSVRRRAFWRPGPGSSRLLVACEPLEDRILFAGQTFVVSELGDVLDPSTGLTLREAVIEANATPGLDQIVINDISGQFLKLDLPEAMGGGTIHITDSVEIVGGTNLDGSTVTIDGLSQMRPFQISGNGVAVTFTDLLIRNGVARNGSGNRAEGGAIRVFGGGRPDPEPRGVSQQPGHRPGWTGDSG